jgi:hypothetical protein
MNKKDRVRTVLMEIYDTNRSRSKYRFCIWYMQQNFTIVFDIVCLDEWDL